MTPFDGRVRFSTAGAGGAGEKGRKGASGGEGGGHASHDKIVRLLKIAWMLQREVHTIEELAARFGVSRRTIYRDLRTITDAGLPLVSQQAGRGYRITKAPPPLPPMPPEGMPARPDAGRRPLDA